MADMAESSGSVATGAAVPPETAPSSPMSSSPTSSSPVPSGAVAFGSVPTELGDVLAAVTDDGLVATAFTDSPHIRAAIAARLGLPEAESPALHGVLDQLRQYFAGSRRDFEVTVDWRLMSVAQRRVL